MEKKSLKEIRVLELKKQQKNLKKQAGKIKNDLLGKNGNPIESSKLMGESYKKTSKSPKTLVKKRKDLMEYFY